jgi:hypothetical protein
MQDPIQKITKAKRAGEIIQLAEHLLSMHNALCSNLSTTKKKKKLSNMA